MWFCSIEKQSRLEVIENHEFDSSSLRDVAVIDQYDAQDFNINENGVIRSDISKLARAQSISEYESVMRRIGSQSAQYNLKDGMTVQQAFDSVRPRQYQSPCELSRFAEQLPVDSDVMDAIKNIYGGSPGDAPADKTGDSPGDVPGDAK